MSNRETTPEHRRRRISPQEVHFAKLMAENGMGGIEAARVAFAWRCEPNSKEAMRAKDLARSARVKDEIKRLQSKKIQVEEAKIALKVDIGEINRGNLREYAFKILEKIRDGSTKGQVRFNAIKILKKLHDPGKDINLVWRWIDVAWRYQTAHCPCCHRDFPLANLPNENLVKWRERNGADPLQNVLPDRFSRRMELIKRADKRRLPHKGQIECLSVDERHIVGLGAARAGKSYLLALFAALGICLPGVEVWILGETFERTAKEVEYLKRFLQAILYPHFNKLVRVTQDKKTGEAIFTTRWGSEVRVKSAKAKGSITGHALEFALCAEPGWLPPDIYEELRARMSERLGRIIALGTPKGVGGFVGRLTNMTGRDPKTGKVIRWKPEERLLKNGAPWNVSMLVTQIRPEDNPEYVKSELDAARMELSDVEYASEFEGIGIAEEGAKFSRVMPHHAKRLDASFFNKAVFVLGIDQGPKNFGSCLVAYDGNTIVPCWEFFNSDERTTMKRNLIRLRARVPSWINTLGGDPDNWLLTITDRDPQLIQTFVEMEEEGQPWRTDMVIRHTNNVKMQDNWRRECQEFVNNRARKDELIFHIFDLPYGQMDDDESSGSYILHDQVMTCADVPENSERESKADNTKGWQTSDPFRGDHVLDAWYFAMWAICSQQLMIPKGFASRTSDDPWADAKAAFNYKFEMQERAELRGHKRAPKGERPGELFEKYFGRRQPGGMMGGGYYPDDS